MDNSPALDAWLQEHIQTNKNLLADLTYIGTKLAIWINAALTGDGIPIRSDDRARLEIAEYAIGCIVRDLEAEGAGRSNL